MRGYRPLSPSNSSFPSLIGTGSTLVSTPSGVQRPLNLGTSRLPPANVNIPQSLGYAFELPDRHRKPFVTLAACEAVAPAVQDALQVIPKGRDQVDGLGQLGRVLGMFLMAIGPRSAGLVDGALGDVRRFHAGDVHRALYLDHRSPGNASALWAW